jgi:hypothetical protein
MNALNTDARKVVVTVKFIAFILPGVVLHFSHCHNISQRISTLFIPCPMHLH